MMWKSDFTLDTYVHKWHLWLIASLLTILFKQFNFTGMSILLKGEVTVGYQVFALITSIVVVTALCVLVFYTSGKFTRQHRGDTYFRTIITACPVPMALIDGAQNITMLNSKFNTLFGYSAEDITTLNDWWMLACPDQSYRQSVSDSWTVRLENMKSNGTGFEPLEVKVCCKNGMSKSVLASASQLGSAYESEHLIVLYDISELVGAHKELTESHNILRSIIETIPMRVFWKDKESRYLGCNTLFARDGGENIPEDLIGKQDSQLAWRAQADIYRADDQEVMQQNVSKLAYDEPQTTNEGSQIWLRTSKVPLYSASGETLGVLGIYEDITEYKQVAQVLRQKEEYQRALIDNFPFQVWLKNTDGHFLAVNQVLANALGYNDPDTLVGKTDFDFYSPLMAARHREDDSAVLALRQKITKEEEQVDHLGVRRWIETFRAPVIDGSGKDLGTVGFARDITERKKVETDLRIAAAAFESQEGMIVTDTNTVILKVNHSFTRITGYTEEEAVGQKMNLLKSGFHDAVFYSRIWRSISRTGSWQGEVWNRRKDGEAYPEWLTVTAVKADDGAVTHYVGTMLDITTRKTIEDKVHHLAHHDTLTDLPNRLLLTDRLYQASAQVRRESGMLALLYLDLDKFKPVNDTLGHSAGDLLLKQVALRLLACVGRESDTVSRLGGDEFVVLLSKVEGKNDAAIVANKILYSLNQPFTVEQHTVSISVSIGIGIYPSDGMDVISLMKNTDKAMYHAKKAGRSCFKYYTPEIEV